jgi:hypothetical protein
MASNQDPGPLDPAFVIGISVGRIGQPFATHATITLTHARGSWRNGRAPEPGARARDEGIIDQAKGI